MSGGERGILRVRHSRVLFRSQAQETDQRSVKHITSRSAVFHSQFHSETRNHQRRGVSILLLLFMIFAGDPPYPRNNSEQSTPNEIDWRLDVRVNALHHWTGVRCILEPLLILRAGCPRDSNRDSQAIDSSRWRAAHSLLNCCRGSGEVNIQSSGNDAHRGQHARAE
jgi:hypothetical protein